MNYKDLELKNSYISCGDVNIVRSFLVPALECTKVYKRSVGFFSSGVFELLMDGIGNMVRKKGRILLIASPKLSEEDVAAINSGYKKREILIGDSFSKEFTEELEKFDDYKLQFLSDIIECGVMDIKIAVTNTLGQYHDKLGILEDYDGNKIAFYGSSNSSKNGYRDNYEKIRLAKSWTESGLEAVEDEEQEFDSLWNNTNEFVEVYEYKDSAKKQILEVIKRRSGTSVKEPIKLREYQEKAINSWVNNNYHGFYVMATGTGKTWTAIYSAKKLMEKELVFTVICAPYKHLVKQWAEDVEKAFPKAKIILVSSENPDWEKQISDAIIKKRYSSDLQIIVISTIVSFNKSRFKDTIAKSNDKKLLIVDEAHRFTQRDEELKTTFGYMLGLSATPFSGTSAAKGKELMEFFGGEVFSLPIEEALSKENRGKYLVPYYYYPIFVHATTDEENMFKAYSKKILSCFKNNKCIDPDKLIKALRGRLRVISMAKEKQNNLGTIIDSIEIKDHFVVYCGDGRLFDDSGEEIRHIQSVKRVLTDRNIKCSQFTAKESMSERMQLVDSFNKNEISSLVAIRCLDEGINIPSIKSALILSSNDDYREFVQRRGRILRKNDDKESAVIYDVIVLPSLDMDTWAKIEFRRFREYAHLALNWDELSGQLNSYLSTYGIDECEIDVYDYEDVEEESDE